MLVNIENKKKIEKPDFSKLLEKSNQLTSQTENQEFLIQRNLEQIDEITKKLTSKVSKVSTDITKNKAYLLFLLKNIDNLLIVNIYCLVLVLIQKNYQEIFNL